MRNGIGHFWRNFNARGGSTSQVRNCRYQHSLPRNKDLSAVTKKCTVLNRCLIRPFSTTSVTNNINITTEINQKGRQLTLTTEHGESLEFPSIWLRFNCHCLECKQDQTRAKLINPATIDLETTIQATQITNNGKELQIKWTDHEGTVPIEHLLENNFNKFKVKERHSWIRKPSLPIMSYPDMISSKANVLKWLREINDCGMCLLTDVPTEENTVVKVAECIGPVQETMYGRVFDVRDMPNPINAAYTSVQLPCHMDLIYYEAPPGIQLFHSIQFDNSVIGGDSILLDVFHVAELFRIEHPEDFEILTKIPATYERIHYKRERPVKMQIQRPHIVLNDKQEIVTVNWHPGMEGPLSVPQEDVERYYKAYQKFAKAIIYSPDTVTVRLKPGHLLAMNNRKALHGRQEYQSNGGVRFLQGCYVLFDDFISQIKVLSMLTGDKKPLKNVGFQI